MSFVELRFLIFFGVVFGVHWALRGARVRKLWLWATSYAFYAAWDWRFLGLIVGSTLVDYVVALRLDGGATRRRAWLGLSLAVNLGVLAFYKYFDFFSASAVELGQTLGVTLDLPTLNLLLPVGISFYTFQTLSYTLDVYFGRLEARRSLLDVALFVGFFPQLVAGPIVRASEFLPQLDGARRFANVQVRAALSLFLVGFFKKACVADGLAPWVDQYFADPAAFDALSAWLAVLAYSTQIFCDFSGYSDMAIACAALLGYRLPINFDAPYLAASPTDFWRRWHISLSSWLRDYLYIPLGGNRGTQLFTHRNLMLTMLLGGLWHGAAWTFVIWGGLHGLGLVLHKEWRRRGWAERVRLPKVAGWMLCMIWVAAAWIFFRAATLEQAWATLRPFATLQSSGTQELPRALGVFLAVLFCVHWGRRRLGRAPVLPRLPHWAFGLVFGVAFAVALALVPANYTPFIYFQF